MFNFGLPELVIVLVILLVLFVGIKLFNKLSSKLPKALKPITNKKARDLPNSDS